MVLGGKFAYFGRVANRGVIILPAVWVASPSSPNYSAGHSVLLCISVTVHSTCDDKQLLVKSFFPFFSYNPPLLRSVAHHAPGMDSFEES